MNLFEKLNRLDDSLVQSKSVVSESIVGRQAKPTNRSGRVLWHMPTLTVLRVAGVDENNTPRYYVREEGSGREYVTDLRSLWMIDAATNPVTTKDLEDDYDDDMDEMLTESTEQYELSTLVKDSINHLVNDLSKDPMADDFGDDVCADLENNYDIYVPQNPVKYADWCDAVMNEVSRQLNKDEELTEGYRVDPEISKFNVGDRVAERYNDSEFNVGTIIEIKEDAEGTQYLVKWDYSDREDEEWLYGDVLSLWVEDETEDVYDDDIDEPLIEEASEVYYLELFSKDGRTFEQSFSTYQEAEEEGNFSLENNPMTKEYIIYDKRHKRVKHER